MNAYTIENECFSIREIRIKILKPILFPKPFYDATMGPFSSYRTMIMTMVDDSGYEGEIEYPLSCLAFFKEYFAPVLLESRNTSYSDIYQRMFWRIRNEGFKSEAAKALGYLDRIFYDIAARRAAVPLHQYLGAKRNWAKLYASGGSTALTDDELIAECLGYMEDGYDTLKIKVGGDYGTHLQEDIKRIEKVRNALGFDINLALDFNQVLRVGQTLDFLKGIDGLDILWIEEPIHSADILGMQELTSRTNMCISYGESERTHHAFQLMASAGIKHLQPVANNMISIEAFNMVCEIATKHNLMLSCGSFPNVNAQLIAAQKEEAMCEYLIPILKPIEPYFNIQPTIKDGKAFLPEIDGVSVRFNWDKINKENLIADSVLMKSLKVSY